MRALPRFGPAEASPHAPSLARDRRGRAGTISYKEFTDALFEGVEPKPPDAASGPKSLTGKTLYQDNAWLKGSNGIFEGVFGGKSEGAQAAA